MTQSRVPNLKILAGSAHSQISEAIAKELGVSLCKLKVGKFANGEISATILESVRGDDVFVVQSHVGNVNDAIMEQAILIDAARRASAGSITAVIPFMSYARQDRKSRGREPISARLVIDILVNAGADRILSIDLHTGQIQGFMNGPFEHLIARPILIDYIKQNFDIHDLVIVSPDAGRIKSAERYSRELDCEIAIVHKHRSQEDHTKLEARHVIGNVEGKTCIIVDDMIDTASTLCAAADLIAQYGAKEVYGAATHGLFSDPAAERIEKSSFKQIITTDTIPRNDRITKSVVLPTAPILAAAINEIHNGGSVSDLFNGDNQF